MGFRYQKRVRLSKNLYLNVGRRGISPGMRTKWGSVNTRGFNIRTGIPGLTYRKSLKNSGCMLFMLVFLTVSTALVTLATCSHRENILQAIPAPANPHLLFESNPISRFITYPGYVVMYDTARKIPAYTIHRLTYDQITDSAGVRAVRTNSFQPDPRLASQCATDSDYYQSGYDRGHHVPAGDFVRSQALKNQSFMYTNVSPQNPKLNRGVFARLEQQVREGVLACSCDAYIVTGTLCNKTQPFVGDQVAVPAKLYKLVYFPSEKRMYAFCFPNDQPTYSGDFNVYQCTVDDIESFVRQDFFDRLPDEVEGKMERSKRIF